MRTTVSTLNYRATILLVVHEYNHIAAIGASLFSFFYCPFEVKMYVVFYDLYYIVMINLITGSLYMKWWTRSCDLTYKHPFFVFRMLNIFILHWLIGSFFINTTNQASALLSTYEVFLLPSLLFNDEQLEFCSAYCILFGSCLYWFAGETWNGLVPTLIGEIEH